LEVPEGTRLRFRGWATRPLEAGTLSRADGKEMPLSVEEDRFGLDWRVEPESSGHWSWRLVGAAGTEAADAAALDLRVVADSAPRVRIASPDPDAIMPPSL